MRIGNQTVLFKSHTAYKQNSSYINNNKIMVQINNIISIYIYIKEIKLF